ncbi:MAG TPA: glycosyl hydrolase [Burkholderiaceae bacterium]
MKCRQHLACVALAAACAVLAAPAGAASLHQPGDGSDAVLGDGAATPETKAVYNLLKGLTLKANSNMLEGQHLGGPGDLVVDPGTQDMFDMQGYRIDSVSPGPHAAYPRMVGARYDANVTPNQYVLDPALVAQINQKLVGIEAAYGPVISITATPLNPWNPAAGRSYDTGDGALSKLFIANRGQNAAATAFWNDIDTIATGLANLKTADGTPIPVLFRPFAEFNTDKYYFHKQSSADFVTLWQQVVDYYRGKQLHNLIICWEAWVWGSSSAMQPSQVDIAPWYPGDSYVDVVSGAFYFQKNANVDNTPYFNLDIPPGSDDFNVFYNLTNLAVTHDKPFGAAQWGLNYKSTPPGDDANTLAFMSAMDAKHANNANQPAGQKVQHMGFAYYWTGAMQVQTQDNAAAFVNDPRVSSITGVQSLAAEDGWIQEANAGSNTGGSKGPAAYLQTGDSGAATCKNCQLRSIVSFDTTSTLPAGATLVPSTPVTLLVTSQGTVGTSPFANAAAFGPLCVDAAWTAATQAPGWFGAGNAFALDDFPLVAASNASCVATLPDPSLDAYGRSFANIGAKFVNRAAGGRTQLRLRFTGATDNNNSNNYVSWYAGDAGRPNAPQLVFTTSLPN